MFSAGHGPERGRKRIRRYSVGCTYIPRSNGEIINFIPSRYAAAGGSRRKDVSRSCCETPPLNILRCYSEWDVRITTRIFVSIIVVSFGRFFRKTCNTIDVLPSKKKKKHTFNIPIIVDTRGADFDAFASSYFFFFFFALPSSGRKRHIKVYGRERIHVWQYFNNTDMCFSNKRILVRRQTCLSTR